MYQFPIDSVYHVTILHVFMANLIFLLSLHFLKSLLYHRATLLNFWNENCSLFQCHFRVVATVVVHYQDMSRVMRKPAFCICKNKGADQ